MASFILVKNVQVAKDFGLEWFTNGASKQIVYTLLRDSEAVKTLVSTEYDKIMYCHILKVDTADGSEFFEYRFSINPKKKFWAKTFLTISAENGL